MMRACVTLPRRRALPLRSSSQLVGDWQGKDKDSAVSIRAAKGARFA